jgi:NOL1/NOP2/sun family putative RNA methylase
VSPRISGTPPGGWFPTDPRAIPLERLERYRPIIPDFDAFVEANLAPEPVNLRVRTGLTTPEALDAALTVQGFELAPVPGLPTLRKVMGGPHSVAQTLEHWLGHLHVQQAVMALPSLALAPRPGERVLDLCAAPGGKTSHMAELMEDRGCLVAVDPKEKRLRGLMANLFRLGHTGILVVASDGRELPAGALFDRVLVDAPCSAEGNFRRTRGRLPKRDAKFVRYVTGLQETLLRRAIALTRPGGTLVYSTCTWAPEENEAVVSRVLEDAPVEVEAIPLDLPHAPGIREWEGERFADGLEKAWRLYPQHLDSGGAFMVRLRRLEDGGGAGEAGGPKVGWSPIPVAFPGEDPVPARARIDAAVHFLREGFQVDPALLDRLGWMARAENLWVHTAGEWPVEGWGHDGRRSTPRPSSGGWRVVSLGLRAFREGSEGRETPSTAFLTRFAHALGPDRRVDVTDDELRRLLARERIPRPEAPLGPVAVAWRGRVLGRGMAGRPGLELQVPRSQATRLAALLAERKDAFPDP